MTALPVVVCIGLAAVLGVGGGVAEEPPSADFQPPQLLTTTQIPLPDTVKPPARPVVVDVLIRVDDVGEVAWVKLLSPPEPELRPFHDAVLVGAASFRFKPARYQGEAVEVEITFQQTFESAALEQAQDAKPSPPGADFDSVLVAELIERGTRRSVPTAHIVIEVAGEEFAPQLGADARFRIRLPAGRARVEILSVDHQRFVVHETLRPGESLQVRYLLQRLSYLPFETVVIGKRERTVVARTTLRDREIKQVPGTFGDPFRVITTLPGVGQMMSLIAYPIVRGTSPGNTAFLLDGVPVPQLFHLLAGPAVIHPEFIERVDFYPGVFPVQYGGYTGGVVDGITKKVRAEEGTVDIDLDLLKTGFFARGRLDSLGITGVAAGRIGYPAVILTALNLPITLWYWDYQAQLDGDHGPGRWKIFSFGSFDELGQKATEDQPAQVTARAQFHRIDMSYRVGSGREHDRYQLVLGLDQSLARQNQEDAGPATLTSWSAHLKASWGRILGDTLHLAFGAKSVVRHLGTEARVVVAGGNSGNALDATLRGNLLTGGAHAALTWQPSEDLIVVPSLRADIYGNADATQFSLDPRLLTRYRVRKHERGDTWLKAGVGLFHQPPRFLIPLPGFEDFALKEGLLRSFQAMLGIELPVLGDFVFDGQVYYHHMDPIIVDLAFNDFIGESSEPVPFPDNPDPESFLDRRPGRSYGLEVMLKHHGRGRVFGWLSYTLSWSERRRPPPDGWVPFDFDRRHMLHLVAGISLPRNWDIALRFQLQTGRPEKTAAGFNKGRGKPFYRIDVRIDKRAVWNDWILDFYVDVINATLSPENVGGGILTGFPNGLRYVLPTIGLRARF